MASSGDEALALLQAGLRPRLILLDAMMPRMNGRQFCQALTAEPELGGAPVVLVSGDLLIDRRAVEMRAAGHLRKPFSAAELLAVVERYQRA
jgi:putative two-component system response regulator